ncbi:Roquin-2 [Frankliniella fusca]|uniref:Roquin-2 n=1 Tax=Frankliniella fusca TaxID=407009 RepID=A0AAE1H4Q6_9NEOP|nr:Roquin-2 [Frankliniella fusca]
MSRYFIDMELQCDICFVQFDLKQHRPKSLPCGHTVCKECVQNPALGKKCPTCRKGLAADLNLLPDNIFVTRMMGEDSPPRKVPRWDCPGEQRLQRGVEAARRLVLVLRKAVPLAVRSVQALLDSSEHQLHQLEEQLARLQREAAGEDVPAPAPAPDLQQVLRLEDSFRLLATNKCTVVAEEGASTWQASTRLEPQDHIARLLLLQLRSNGHLEKVDAAEPPALSTLSTTRDDYDARGELKVDDVIEDGRRWRRKRILTGVKGRGSEKLLRVMSPLLEELEFSSEVTASVMAQVEQMASLRRLVVGCDCDSPQPYPELPLQLEELAISYPREQQLRALVRMPRLRALDVIFHDGPDVLLPASPHGALLWLGVCFSETRKATMLSLIRAFAASVQELQVYTAVSDEAGQELGVPDYYFADLGRDLASCGLRALRRLVLERPGPGPGPGPWPRARCAQLDACLLQRQRVRQGLPPGLNVDVFCGTCHKSVL